MTRFDPSLKVCRVVVIRSDKIVYDESFHDGVNIIRGENASGKTTISDIIYHALGGEEVNWRDAALLCDHTIMEVELNGAKLTLKRRITTDPKQDMRIYWGPLEQALGAVDQAWDVYPYASQGTKLSFSNALFRAMGIPEARGALTSRLTMHQLLRLMCVDQVTPFDKIFRREKFDSELVRGAVGALLCGFYQSEHYDIELLIREKSSELDGLRGQVRTAYNVLGGEKIGITDVSSALEKKRAEQLDLLKELDSIRNSEVRVTKRSDAKSQKVVDEIEVQIRKQNQDILDIKEKLDVLRVDIADSELFMVSVRSHLSALDDAALVRRNLGEASFELCPSCFSVVVPPTSTTQCALCKNERTPDKVDARLMRIKQELAQQLSESTVLQKARVERQRDLEGKLEAAFVRKEQLQVNYRQLALPAMLGPETAQADFLRRVGYVGREIEELDGRLRLAQSVDQMRQAADALENELSELQKTREHYEAQRLEREFESQALIVELTSKLLAADVDGEESFRNARSVAYSFAKDRLLVDNRMNYAASSMVYAKNCFHVALLLASAEQSFFRYPRFILIDNVEDKGMTPERSQNFQRLLVKMSAALSVPHQIIFSTSVIAPELDKSSLTVGEFYRPERKSLRIQDLL